QHRPGLARAAAGLRVGRRCPRTSAPGVSEQSLRREPWRPAGRPTGAGPPRPGRHPPAVSTCGPKPSPRPLGAASEASFSSNFQGRVMKRRTPLLAWAVLLGTAGAVPARQEPAYTAELQFVRELRARHYDDLALQYLERLRKGATPALARELPLEMAKTRLEAAADEPDSGKRLALYEEAGKEFERFLADPANAAHPRRGEAQFEAARVKYLRGRTLLGRAVVQDTPEAQEAESAKARAALADAGKEIRKAAAALDAQLAALAEPKTPAERAQMKRLEADRLEAELQAGLNLFDQAQTYP